jgi:hypothetical protein
MEAVTILVRASSVQLKSPDTCVAPVASVKNGSTHQKIWTSSKKTTPSQVTCWLTQRCTGRQPRHDFSESYTSSRAVGAGELQPLDRRMTDRVDGYGTCPSGHRFPFILVHNGFNDTGYAYCDSCGMTTLVGGWDDTRRPAAAPLCIQGPIQIETEPWLESCACGGHFSANAEPRCPKCQVALSAEDASTFIEKNAPGTKKGWKWQRSWNGIYCIVIAGRLVQNNWLPQPRNRPAV